MKSHVRSHREKTTDWEGQLRSVVEGMPSKEILDKVASRAPRTAAERIILLESASALGRGDDLDWVFKGIRAKYSSTRLFDGVSRIEAAAIVDVVERDTRVLAENLPREAAQLILSNCAGQDDLNAVMEHLRPRLRANPGGRVAHDPEAESLEALKWQSGKYPLPKRRRNILFGGVALAAAIAVGISLLPGTGRQVKVGPTDTNRTEELWQPQVSPAPTAESEEQTVQKTQEIPPADKAYLDGQVNALETVISEAFRQSKYGYAELVRSPKTSIFRATNGLYNGLLVFDTKRVFGAGGGQTVLGSNPFDCGEATYAVMPLLVSHFGDKLEAIEARQVFIPREIGGADAAIEHWVNLAHLNVNSNSYTITVDATPLNRHASPWLMINELADLDNLNFVKGDDPELDAGRLAAVFAETKTERPMSSVYEELPGIKLLESPPPYQPMMVIDGAGGYKVEVDAGIQEAGSDIRFLFCASRFKPGDEKSLPEFGQTYCASVSMPKAELAKYQRLLEGKDPAQVLNVMGAGGAKVETSGADGLSPDLRKAIPNVDLLHHLIVKTHLQ